MRRGIFFAVVLIGVVAFATAAAGSSARGGQSGASLDLYTGVVSSAQLGQLVRQGYEVDEASAGRRRRAGRPRADEGRRREAGGAGHRREAAARQAGPHAGRARGGAGGRRLHRLALVRREGRHSRRALLDRAPEPADREARGDRPHDPGPRDHRAEGDEGREDARRRRAAGRALHVDDPRARVDLHRGQPPAAPPLRGQLRQERGDHEPRQHARAVVPDRREPGRLPVHVRPRTAVAQEPPRQRRRRSDHARRRRRPEPQLRRGLGLRQRGLERAVLGRRLPRHRRRPPSPRCRRTRR